jgi:dihydrofolate reductase
MKVILVATITADGFTARDSQHLVDWTSGTDKGTFSKLTKEMGVIVMGYNSYATVTRDLSVGGRRVIVYTKSPEKVTAPWAETTQEEPAELLARLEREGHDGVAICGGSQIYTMFAEAGLYTDLYIVSEAHILGSGLTLFTKPLTMPIELFEVTVRRGRTVVNHYKVLKHPA